MRAYGLFAKFKSAILVTTTISACFYLLTCPVHFPFCALWEEQTYGVGVTEVREFPVAAYIDERLCTLTLRLTGQCLHWPAPPVSRTSQAECNAPVICRWRLKLLQT